MRKNTVQQKNIRKPPLSLSFEKLILPLLEIDRTLLILLMSFLTFGLLIIYDATAILSQELYGFAYRFVLLQFAWILVGGIGFYFFATLDHQKLKKLASPMFITALVILVVLALFGALPCSVNFMFAPCINGANRWFYLNPPPFPEIPVLGILGFQPSEFAKLALVLFMSALMARDARNKDKNNWSYVGVLELVSLLVFLQPNLSTTVLIFFIGSTLYFVGGGSLSVLIKTYLFNGIGAIIATALSPYRRARLMTFLGGANNSSDLASGYHIKQISIALGSGGLTGLGLGQSRQKFQYLPEVFADSIFAIIGEELGFFGTAILVLLFGLLIYKGYSIAKNAPDIFSKLLATGVTTWIALQFFVNVGAMTQIIPLTGIPLPLISYGGSSLVFMLMGLGLLANVSRSSNTLK